MTDAPPPPSSSAPLSRRRDCDPLTSSLLRKVEDAGVLFDILESTDEATVVRFRRSELDRLVGRLRIRPRTIDAMPETPTAKAARRRGAA